MKMKSYLQKSVRVWTIAMALAALSYQGRTAQDQEGQGSSGHVFTMDNSTGGNHVLMFQRSHDGTLSEPESFPTGGNGTGSGLGSQGAVALSENSRWLFACNAGSDEVSVLLVTHRGLFLTDKVSSHGRNPISLTLHQNVLYVLNAGGQVGEVDNINAFLFFAGKLHPISGSARPLSAANTEPAQVSFSERGDVLVVTEKATSRIDTYTVDNDGTVSDHKVFDSVGQTPFGFAFRKRDLLVSEAFGGAPDASTVSSYELAKGGELSVISPSVPTTETAACWVVVTDNGHFAYASNTGSGTISGYNVKSDGEITLLNPNGVTGVTGPGSTPIDMALSENNRFLYCLNAGNGTISAFQVGHDGSLSTIGTWTGIAHGATGLAAR